MALFRQTGSKDCSFAYKVILILRYPHHIYGGTA